jgi:hypothetical protein
VKDILPCSLVYPNKELKKALLIVDRGSREPAVRQELEELCSLVKSMGTHSYVDYCFLAAAIYSGRNQQLYQKWGMFYHCSALFPLSGYEA